MATLEDILAASKALDETSGNPVGAACSKTEESQNVVSDVKKDDGKASEVVITKQIVETVTVVESTLDRNSCLANMGKEKVGVGGLGRVSNGETFYSVNNIDVNVGVDGSSCGDIASDEKIKDGEGSCTGIHGSSTVDSKEFHVTGEKSSTDADGDEYGEGNGDDKKLECQDHGFCVGDFVWGKIKSHPWWPGQIYDPKDASEFAMKHGREGRLLVAFYGDASCSWCLPSQLKPFVENFNEMSVESSAKSFANALESAVDEIGRLVESDMTCKCVPLKERDVRPLVSNAGVKEGVLAPVVDIHRLSVPEYKPNDIFATLKHIAIGGSAGNVLELAVLRSWLSAFYHAKGSYPLPVYCDPLEIEGMEDKSESASDGNNDFSVPIEVPILGPQDDDWLPSPSANTTKSQAEDKTYHRRKQKSVAELMAEKPDVKPRSRERRATKGGKDVGKSTSSLKRRKGNDGEVEESGSKGASLTGKNGKKKKKEKEISDVEEVSNAENSGTGDDANNKKKKKQVSESHKAATENGSDAENIASEDDASKGTSLRKQKKLEVVVTEYSLDEAKEVSELVSTPRERKKSKYLCPPYTSPTWRIGNSSFKMGTVSAKSPKEENKLGEQTSKASGYSSTSESAAKSVDRLPDDKVTDGHLKEDDSSVEATTPTVKDTKLSIVASDVDIPLNDLISDIQFAALDPFYLSNKGSLDMVWAFVSALRSAIYLHGPEYKIFQKCKSRKKRKSLHSSEANEESDKSHETAKSTGKRLTEERMERKAGKSAAKRIHEEEEKTEKRPGKSAAKRISKEEKMEKKAAGKTAAKRMREEEKTERKAGKSGAKQMDEEEKMERKAGKSAAKQKREEEKTEHKSGKSGTKKSAEEDKTEKKSGKSASKKTPEEDKTERKSGKSAAKRMLEDEKTEGKSGKSKSKKATETSRATSKAEKSDANTSSCIVLEFAPEYPLPSKEEIVKLFSKYGDLNEEETHAVMDSHSVHIKYMKDTDAEVAFQSSLSEKPFGGESVINSRLEPSPAGSKSPVSHPKVASRKRARKDPESTQPDDLLTDVQVIKQKLEIMSAILENYHTKFTMQEKSGLKDEMRGLLESVETTSEKVRIIAENSAS